MAHPDPLRTEYGTELELIRDPACLPLWAGDGLLGWQGDPRLAIYFNRTYLRWELWRLEHDNVYRIQTSWPLAEVRGGEIVGKCILYCLECDRQRGYDLLKAMAAIDARGEQNRAYEHAQAVGEAQDRIAWGLRKDLR